MLLEMIRREMRIDAVVFADTTMEFPAMYEHIDRVEQLLKSKRGISITLLKGNQNFEELMFEAIRVDDRHDVSGFGWPGAIVRWCTGQLKAHLLERFSKSFSIRPYCFVGFASDETHRLKRKNNQGPLKCYPLIKWGVTEAEALAGCYREGYTWDGLYEHFSHVSCWCCPLQSLKELRTLHECYPEIWAELRRLYDKAIAQFGRDHPYGQFRQKESVRMLELRFDFEKEWAAHGWSIRSKAFYRALNLLYQKYCPASNDPVDELLSYATEDDLKILSLIGAEHKRNVREKTAHRKSGLLR